MIELGDRVRDVVTHFEGIAIGRCVHITGPATVGVQPGVVSLDGKLSDSVWFEESRLAVVKPREVVIGGGGGGPHAPDGTRAMNTTPPPPAPQPQSLPVHINLSIVPAPLATCPS